MRETGNGRCHLRACRRTRETLPRARVAERHPIARRNSSGVRVAAPRVSAQPLPEPEHGSTPGVLCSRKTQPPRFLHFVLLKGIAVCKRHTPHRRYTKYGTGILYEGWRKTVDRKPDQRGDLDSFPSWA
jgi:hypothetical protein